MDITLGFLIVILAVVVVNSCTTVGARSEEFETLPREPVFVE